MQVVAGRAEIDDVTGFFERLAQLGESHGCLVQAVDARYVAGERHLERAVQLAQRAIESDQTIADDPAMELLLYIAATRQINQALEIGVTAGTQPVAIVIAGGDEAGAAETVRSWIEPDANVFAPDEERLAEWFGISQAERTATDASLEDLVCERVALLVLDA